MNSSQEAEEEAAEWIEMYSGYYQREQNKLVK